MQVVFDFISGNISFDEFWKEYEQNPQIGEWIDCLTDFSGDPPPKIVKDSRLLVIYRAVPIGFDGHILGMMAHSPYPPTDSYPAARRKCRIFDMILAAVTAKYPDVKPTKCYRQDDDYYYKALGNSIGGNEVMDYAASVLDQFPRTMKAAERVKAGKEALWKAFHIEDRKFPRWVQGADWPMGKNSPMEYLGLKRDGEQVSLRFRDVDTGEERIVEQFY